MMLSRQVVAILVCVSLVFSAKGQLYDQLYEDVVSHANKNTIPLRYLGDTLNVNFSLNLIQLLSLNAETGEAVFDMWPVLRWNDGRLAWNSTEYGGVSELRVPYSNIWSPDIVLYNGYTNGRESNYVLSPDGSVVYVPKTTVETRCYSDDDSVMCALKFGSWTYSGDKLNLTVGAEGVGVGDYMVNRQWEIFHTSSERHTMYYSCCPEPYIDIIFTMAFRRRGGDSKVAK